MASVCMSNSAQAAAAAAAAVRLHEFPTTARSSSTASCCCMDGGSAAAPPLTGDGCCGGGACCMTTDGRGARRMGCGAMRCGACDRAACSAGQIKRADMSTQHWLHSATNALVLRRLSSRSRARQFCRQSTQIHMNRRGGGSGGVWSATQSSRVESSRVELRLACCTTVRHRNPPHSLRVR